MSFPNTKSPTKTEIKKKPKYIVPTQGKKLYLTDELKAEFTRLFPKTPNRKMMELFGISFTTMQRFKKELNLQKDMTIIRKKLAKQVKQICEKNGYYDSLRGHPITHALAGAKAYRESDRYESSWSILKRTDRRTYNRKRKLCGQHLKERYRKERRRDDLCLAQETRLNIRHYSKKQRYYRSRLRSKNYILGDYRSRFNERFTIFYDDETHRSIATEKNAEKFGFVFKRLEE